MRALRALPRRRPRRQAGRPQALRRHRAAPLRPGGRGPLLALLVAALALPGLGGLAGAKPKPKPPKPKVDVLTTRQDAALDKRKIKLEVRGKKGAKARVKGKLVVDGYPTPYEERLGPDKARLRGGDARMKLRLDRRDEEILHFGHQACWAAHVQGKAEAAGRGARFHQTLEKPAGC